MGVFGLLNWIKYYGNRSFNKWGISLNGKCCDNLYLDFNSLIHNAATLPLVNEDVIFTRLDSDMKAIINILKPKKLTYFAIDGVPPKIKAVQQRNRRYLNVFNKRRLDTNVITPGTEFMSRMNKFIFEQTKHDKTLISNDSNTPGEGEQKIFKYIRENQKPRTDVNVIIGNDSDLILQSLLLNIPNMFIVFFRTDFYKSITNDFFSTISIDSLRKEIIELFVKNIRQYTERLDEDRIIGDFCFLNNFVGTDFLPSPFFFFPTKGNLNNFIQIYYNHFNLTGEYLTNSKELNYNALKHFFFLMEKNERSSLTEWNSDYKVDYYRQKFGFEKNSEKHPITKEIVHHYIKTLVWSLKYYYGDCASWEYYYPFYFTPLITDVCDNMDETDSFFDEGNPGEPMSPIECLLFVLPRKSHNLLPPEYKNYISDNSSPLSEYYPENYRLYFQTEILHLGKVILPFIDEEIFKSETEKIKKIDKNIKDKNEITDSSEVVLKNDEVDLILEKKDEDLPTKIVRLSSNSLDEIRTILSDHK